MARKSNNQYSKKKARNRYKPAVAQWRLDLVRLMVLVTSFGLIVYDAFVSYLGFSKLAIGDHAPIIFCVLIFVVQLGVGILHALGDDFTDVMADSGTGWANSIWVGFLLVLYAIDITSNAIEFGFFTRFSTPLLDPLERVGGALLIMGMAFGLTFADETLLRLYDRVSLAAKRNNIFAKRHSMSVAAHNRYLKVARETALDRADQQGQYEGGQWEFGENL